jgi:hypothetical protein
MKRSIVFRSIAICTIGVLLFFAVDFVEVAFLGGFNINLGAFLFRSITLSFSLSAF